VLSNNAAGAEDVRTMKRAIPFLLMAFAFGLATALALAVPEAGHGKPLADAPASTTAPTTTETPLVWRAGTLTTLGASVAVDGMTCTVASAPSNLGEFKVGDSVYLGCLNGVLAKILRQPTVTTTATATAAVTMPPPETQLVWHAGPITALGGTITVDGTTCGLSSPPSNLGEFKVGDRVYMGCANGLLVKILRQPTPPTTSTTAATTTSAPAQIVTKEDSVVALSSTSISVGPVTCALTGDSPSVASLQVGVRVAIACSNGTLVKLVVLPPLRAPVAPTTTSAPQSDTAGFSVRLGTIGTLTPSSITVGGLVCSLGDGSPDLGAYKVGDAVGVGCAGGMLFMIGKLPGSLPVKPTPGLKHALAARYRACVKAGVSADTDGGPTCRIGDLLKRKQKK
jgi:hypothetical protein